MKRWQTLLIGIAVSAVFLFLALRQADFAQIAQAFRTARYGFVVLSFVLVGGTTWIRALRWHALTQDRLSITDTFWLFNTGFLFNNVLPARLGEFARAFLAGRRPDMHFTSALSSIVVERLFDMVAVAVIIGMVLIGLPLPAWARTAGAAMGLGALLGIGVLAIAARHPEWTLNAGATIIAIVPRISQEDAYSFLEPFVEGLGGVSDGRTFVLGMGLSIIAWIASGISGWVLMFAFWRDVPFMVGQLSVAAAGLGIAIPAAPSGVGPFEAAVIGVLTAIDYDANVARSYAFLLHAISFTFTSLFGLIGLAREGMSFGQIADEARTLRKPGHTPVNPDPSSVPTRTDS